MAILKFAAVRKVRPVMLGCLESMLGDLVSKIYLRVCNKIEKEISL